ncbi:MAG: CpsD/CapB family tyrosine-protein kinase, partial [Chloroflexi bacterium]|nr:CpsD/CapB family tyrosine-protein kinase [Chloroflexota bacterium]
AFHSISANLKLSRTGSTVRSLLVTSPGPSEGKTLTAVNLAVALAEGGDRVVLVDADLRRPAVHKYFGIANGVGLTNFLMSGSESASDYLMATVVEHLWVLPSGPLPPRPQVLLSLPRMDRLLAELREEADLIIVDSPPVMAVADSVVLGNRVDGILMVVMAGRTGREMLVRTKETLANVGAVLVGSVLNKVRSSELGSYYLYYYYRQSRQRPSLRVVGELSLPQR